MDTVTAAPPDQIKPMSFLDRLTNIFASPGELFDNVRLTPPSTGAWLVPTILLIVVSLVLGQVVVSNPTLADQMKQMVKKEMDKQIAAGKMTQEQADQAEAFTQPGSTMATIIRVAATTLGIPIVLFVVALFYWLLGRWAMRAAAPYMKVVEVVGLTFYISILGSILTTIMMIVMGSIFASPSLAVAVSDFDVENKAHMALSQVNAFSIWSLIVTSIGLAKLFQRDMPKVLVLVFALWVLWSIFSILTGIRFS